MKVNKRRVDLVILSDIHLGTPGCHAKELLQYLRSIKPKQLILNGDIIDIWQFKKRYWPKSHMKVIRHLISLSTKGTRIYYITGNHDETLRKFSDQQIGNISIHNQMHLKLGDQRAWIFHGDVFDVIMQYSKWIARLGAIAYDLLIQINMLVNFISRLLGRKKISLSKRIKDNVKGAIKYINNFEETAAQLAVKKGYNVIICGHIHHPEMRWIKDNRGNAVLYLNSGDWVENLTALEYHKNQWHIYQYDQDLTDSDEEKDELSTALTEMDNKQLFNRMLAEFQN